MRLVFDLESDDLLEGITTIHCIVAKNRDTEEKKSFGPDQIDEGLKHLGQADELCGSNILGFDLPALAKVKNWYPKPGCKIRDLLVESRLKYSDLTNDDLDNSDEVIRRLHGRQSVKAWGVRLGVLKIDFAKLSADESGEEVEDKKELFKTFTPQMLAYCEQDVEVSEAHAKYLDSTSCPDEAIRLEHDFAAIADSLHTRGFSFDVAGAQALCQRVEEKGEVLRKAFKNWVPDTFEDMKKAAHYVVTWPDGSKENFPSKGEAEKARKERKVRPKDCHIEAGPVRQKTIEFNMNSRDQVREYLFQRYQWLSPELTDKGEELLKAGGIKYDDLAKDYGSISEDVLRTLEFPEAAVLADFMLLKKRLSQIRDGQGGWLKLVKDDGRIHHTMNPIGCATMRCAHYGPNLGQVPHVLTNKAGEVLLGMAGRYGAECRELFRATEGYDLVGTDLSGIEARLLGHFLHPYDGGKYCDLVLNGDIHAANADAIKKIAAYEITRGDSKTPFYGWLYGGGHEKLGKVVVSTTPSAKKEFLSILAEMQRGTTRVDEIASLVRWGCETPRDTADQRFQRLIWSVKACSDLQKATWIAYSAVGGRIDYSFQEGITGLGKLLEDVRKAASKGYLSPMDGRRIPVRSEHAALNTLLQGSAAIVMKRWAVGTQQQIVARKLDAHILAIVHDEIQAEVRPDQVQTYRDACLASIKMAGAHYRLKIRLDGEAKTGADWRATH